MEQLSLFIFYNFMFGTEKVICPKNSEGWLVGVWDGLSLDRSKLFWVSVQQSKQNPNKRYGWRCNVFLPPWETQWLSSITFVTNFFSKTNNACKTLGARARMWLTRRRRMVSLLKRTPDMIAQILALTEFLPQNNQHQKDT